MPLADAARGRCLAIGDIHGRADLLASMLDTLALQPEDRVVFLGDLIDRGPDSKGVLDQVLALVNAGQAQVVLGNHEEMLLTAHDYSASAWAWLRHGGVECLQSFGLDPATHTARDIPQPYIDLLRQAADFIETDRFIFSHTMPFAEYPVADQDPTGWRWRRLESRDRPHHSGKTVICGHNEQRDSLKPLVMPGIICIDTWAYGDGFLTALDVDRMQVYQVNASLTRDYPLTQAMTP